MAHFVGRLLDDDVDWDRAVWAIADDHEPKSGFFEIFNAFLVDCTLVQKAKSPKSLRTLPRMTPVGGWSTNIAKKTSAIHHYIPRLSAKN